MPRQGFERFAGFHRPRVRARLRRRWRSAGSTTRSRTTARCIEMGDAPSRYTATVGCGTYLPRVALAELLMQIGRRRRRRASCSTACLNEHPGLLRHRAPLRDGAAAQRAPTPTPSSPRSRSGSPCSPPPSGSCSGTALYECGASEQAERQFRLVLERQPHSAQSRVALGETLLSLAPLRRGRRARPRKCPTTTRLRQSPAAPSCSAGSSAARHRRREDRVVPRASAQACRLPSASCSRAGPPAGAASRSSASCRLAGIALLEVILEALLRVQEFKAFEMLVPLLERSELRQREQRELLGAMYLRRGFLQSAAKEWMAVCALQPDPRALVGLARVSLAHGLPDDAVVFATEALALEPGNVDAGAIAASARQAAAA